MTEQRRAPSLKTIICMDNDVKDFERIRTELKDVGVDLFKWDEILSIVRYNAINVIINLRRVGLTEGRLFHSKRMIL